MGIFNRKKKEENEAQEIAEEVKNLSEHKRKKDDKKITEEENMIIGMVRSENQKIRALQEKVKETDEELKKVDIKKIIAEANEDQDDVSMVFSHLRKNILYIHVAGEEIEEMCHEVLKEEKEIKKTIKNYSTKEEKHELKLFKKDEEEIKKMADKIKRKAKTLETQATHLGSAEDGEEKDEEEIQEIEKSVKKLFGSFGSLRKNLNRLSIEFNHAIENIKEIMKENKMLKQELAKHLYLLQHGKFEDTTKWVSEKKRGETIGYEFSSGKKSTVRSFNTNKHGEKFGERKRRSRADKRVRLGKKGELEELDEAI